LFKIIAYYKLIVRRPTMIKSVYEPYYIQSQEAQNNMGTSAALVKWLV